MVGLRRTTMPLVLVPTSTKKTLTLVPTGPDVPVKKRTLVPTSIIEPPPEVPANITLVPVAPVKKRTLVPTSPEVPVKKRTLVPTPPQEEDDEESDSLVRIHEEQERLQEKIQSKSSSSVVNDQMSRFQEAHAKAAIAAELAIADGESDGTVEARANAARAIALPEEIPVSVPLSVPPATALIPQIAAFAGSTGEMPPMSLHENYAMLHQEMRTSQSRERAPTTGQVGMHVAEVSSKLVRELPKQLSGVTLPRVLASVSSPLESTFLMNLVTDVINDASIPPHLNDPFNKSLNAMRQILRVSPRRHEESMLRPPRANELPCAAGQACKGNAIICKDGGETLMAYYFEDEWAQYQHALSTDAPNARLPDNSRLCLLCLRYDTNRFLVATRTQNVQYRIDNHAGGQDEVPVLIQSHFNLVDVPGEYRLEDCNSPIAPVFEGILYPVVKPSLTHFVRAIDETGGVIFRQLFHYPDAESTLTRPTSTSF